MWKVCLIGLVCLGAAPADGVLDAALRNTDDQPVSLSQYRGKPAVLIYEDRHSVEVNRPFKNALRARSEGPHGSDVQVIAVANVARFNFFPVRGFALHHVQEAEKKAHHPLLVDWEDTLARPPWSLPHGTSSVLVLSPAGEVLFSRSGPLTEADQEEVFALLQRLLPEPGTTATPAEAHATSSDRPRAAVHP